MDKIIFNRFGHLLFVLGFLAPLVIATVIAWSHEKPRAISDPPKVGSPNPDTPAFVETIREGRSEIKSMEESLLGKITEQYNLDYEGHRSWAESCLAYRETFEEAEELTLYPAELVAGMAMHESAGCKMSAKDWAGGRGLMQITTPPSKSELKAAAAILGVSVDAVDYKANPTHNVMVGLIRLDLFEREFGSRFHGLQAYNMGNTGLRRTVRKMGYDPTRPPSIIDLKPHLVLTAKMKPRIYVQKIVSSVVMMDRALRGLPLERLDSISPSDVPGWDPADDGADWVDRFGSK